ncbi:mitochondrial carrier domain-containing protein [Lipomyces japonicus]|uniref:mitochondrial carrier domain-containing protein n=1 Tax=Lipomyces japonicus TaxID=56871 RepID=UPI0034CE36A0
MSTKPKNKKVDAVAGFAAGCATTLIVHPLDLIKVRLQIDNRKKFHFGRAVEIANELRSSNSPFKEIYRGLVPNLVGNTTSWASYFYWYETIKQELNIYYGAQGLGSIDYLASAMASGSITVLLTNPVWVIKTRMLSTSSTHDGAYKSMVDGFLTIHRHEGIRGFYRGFLPSLLGVGHGAIQLMVYEKLKTWYLNRQANGHVQLSTSQFITFSAFSKIVASLFMYPYQVVRSRLQRYDADNVYRSLSDVVKKTYQTEGYLGFYKGLIPNLLRVVPATCVTFVVYENTKKYLKYEI